jgi:hypothetical protein
MTPRLLVLPERTQQSSDFCKLLDELPPHTLPPDDLLEQYKFYSIPQCHSRWSGSEVKDHLTSRMKRITPGDERNFLGDLFKELFLRMELGGEQNSSYLAYLELIRHHINPQTLIPCSESDEWTECLLAIRDYYSIYEKASFDAKVKQINQNNSPFAEHYTPLKDAWQYAISKNFEIEFSQTQLSLTERGARKFSRHISSLMEKIGAQNYVEYLTTHTQFNDQFGRYNITRHTKQHGIVAKKIHIPYGWLFQLAAMHVQLRPILSNKDFITELEIAATHYGILHELDSQAGIAALFGWEDLVKKTYDFIVFDSAFLIKQLKPKYAVKIVEKLYSYYENQKLKSTFGWELADLVAVGHFLAICYPGPQPLERKMLSDRCPHLDKAALSSLLKYLSHAKSEVNQGYMPFFDPLNEENYQKLNFYKKPLIALSHDKFLLLEASWCLDGLGHVMYQALLDAGHDKGKIHSDMGYAHEELVEDLFNSRGWQFSQGKHSQQGSNGETDLALETKDTIFIFELKKCSLSDSSSWGNSLRMFQDLSKSLLKSQTQLLKAQQILLNNNCFQLANQPNIELNGREIRRVSVSLHDFGAIHSSTIIGDYLIHIAQAIFNVPDGTPTDIIKGINSQAKKLFVELEKTVELFVQPPNLKPYKKLDNSGDFQTIEETWNSDKWNKIKFETLFLSLPQLMTLLDLSESPDAFAELIKSTQRISDGRMDFYTNLQQVLNNNEYERLHPNPDLNRVIPEESDPDV